MKRLISAIIATSIMCVPVFSSQNQQSSVQIKQQANQTAKEIIQHAGEKSTEKVREKELEKIVKDAVDVVTKSNHLLFLLNHGKIKEAKEEIKKLKEKIDILEKKYGISKLPVDSIVTEITGVTDINQAKKLAEKVKKAVANNDFVTARSLLELLRDEIVIETAYLPVKLYKDAIYLTEKLIKEGKIKSAVNQLKVALGLIEIETTIIPKSIAVASLMVEEASKVYKKEPEKALKLLAEAKRQIKLAKVLGYISNDKSVEPLIKQIESLEKAVREKSGSSQSKFKELFKSIREMKKETTKTK